MILATRDCVQTNRFTLAWYAGTDVVRFGPALPRAEFQMLLFQVERSVCYGKESDRMAISQVENGVPSRTQGIWIRSGCGLKRAAAIRAKKALAKRQLLVIRRHSSPQAGNEPTEFEVD